MGYLFAPQTLHEIAKRRAGLPHEEMVALIIEDLARAYPRHIETRQDWFFSLAGGATGIMTVLHGSLSEYLLLFGSPVGTEGFSGRYWLDIYDFVLSGEMWTYTEEQFRERVATRPGEMAQLRRRQVKGFRIREDTWMLEYGRGLVPTALPVALGDAVFSAMDFRTVFKTLWVYGQLVVRELVRGKI
jgi:ERG2 and Sigma1 receptor like protein